MVPELRTWISEVLTQASSIFPILKGFSSLSRCARTLASALCPETSGDVRRRRETSGDVGRRRETSGYVGTRRETSGERRETSGDVGRHRETSGDFGRRRETSGNVRSRRETSGDVWRRRETSNIWRFRETSGDVQRRREKSGDIGRCRETSGDVLPRRPPETSSRDVLRRRRPEASSGDVVWSVALRSALFSCRPWIKGVQACYARPKSGSGCCWCGRTVWNKQFMCTCQTPNSNIQPHVNSISWA